MHGDQEGVGQRLAQGRQCRRAAPNHSAPNSSVVRVGRAEREAGRRWVCGAWDRRSGEAAALLTAELRLSVGED